jgi:hypothetical protein
MISHKYKFILITPPKTGATSISKSLLSVIEVGEIIKQEKQCPNCFDFTEPQEEKLAKHNSLKDYDEKYINSYTLYGTIRNPYARMVSWWKWKRPSKDFKKWVKKAFEENKSDRTLGGSCLSFFLSPHKNVKKYIRCEDMENDYNSFCEELNLPKCPLYHINKTKHMPYQDYYDSETRKIVENNWAQDIEHFGYKF